MHAYDHTHAGDGRYEFSNIPRGEYANLYKFIAEKNIDIANVQQAEGDMTHMLGADDDDDDGMIESDDDRPRRPRGPGEEGDEESVDEDFDPEGSGRDDMSEEEEYDEDHSTDNEGADDDKPSDEDDEEIGDGSPKPKKVKKEKKAIAEQLAGLDKDIFDKEKLIMEMRKEVMGTTLATPGGHKVKHDSLVMKLHTLMNHIKLEHVVCKLGDYG